MQGYQSISNSALSDLFFNHNNENLAQLRVAAEEAQGNVDYASPAYREALEKDAAAFLEAFERAAGVATDVTFPALADDYMSRI